MAVTWNEATIIWAWLGDNDRSMVYYHRAGQWMRKKTTGTQPSWFFNGTAQVHDDKMWLIGEGKYADAVVIYSLDLKTWSWTMTTPSGMQPLCMLPMGSRISGGSYVCPLNSWIHNDKIYCLGAFGKGQEQDGPKYLGVRRWRDSPIFCYNVSANRYEWPDLKGDTPSFRAMSSVIIKDDTVFMFGGAEFHGSGILTSSLNDLYTLDMITLTWNRIHGSLSPSLLIPRSRFGHTLTRISESVAVLYGGRYLSTNGENINGQREAICMDDVCWLLDLKKIEELETTKGNVWTKMPYRVPSSFHKAVLEPSSKRLLVLGGIDEEGKFM